MNALALALADVSLQQDNSELVEEAESAPKSRPVPLSGPISRTLLSQDG